MCNDQSEMYGLVIFLSCNMQASTQNQREIIGQV